jgi:hypothetical protein
MGDRSDTSALVTRISLYIAPISAQFLLDPRYGAEDAGVARRTRTSTPEHERSRQG